MDDMPLLRSRFRPRTDAALLRRLLLGAWNARNRDLLPPDRVAWAKEGIARWIESLNPLGDLRPLAAQGKVQSLGSALVRLRDGQERPECLLIPLDRPVHVAAGFDGLWHAGPRMEEGTDGMEERLRSPEALAPFFDLVLGMRDGFREERDAAAVFPEEHRRANGRFPTWGELALRCPVLGAHLRGLAA